MAKEIVCSGCQRVIGTVVTVNNQEWLTVNGILVTVMRGVCSECGSEFHWSISERALAKLITRVKKC